MKTFELEGKGREIIVRPVDQKRALKAMCKNNEIPAVLYGGEKATHFTVTKEAVRKLVYTPETLVVELSIDGNKTMAIARDMQFQPVTDEILHMDFLEVFKDKAVVMEVSVILEGHAEGIKAGGKLSLQMRKLKVKVIYDQIPEKLTINVDHLGLGRIMQVDALYFEGLELMNAKNAAVCAVQLTCTARGAQTKGQSEVKTLLQYMKRRISVEYSSPSLHRSEDNEIFDNRTW